MKSEITEKEAKRIIKQRMLGLLIDNIWQTRKEQFIAVLLFGIVFIIGLIAWTNALAVSHIEYTYILPDGQQLVVYSIYNIQLNGIPLQGFAPSFWDEAQKVILHWELIVVILGSVGLILTASISYPKLESETSKANRYLENWKQTGDLPEQEK